MIFLCKDFGYQFLKRGWGRFGKYSLFYSFLPHSDYMGKKILFVYFTIEISLPC